MNVSVYLCINVSMYLRMPYVYLCISCMYTSCLYPCVWQCRYMYVSVYLFFIGVCGKEQTF